LLSFRSRTSLAIPLSLISPSVQTLDERLDATLARERMAASVAAFLAGLAVVRGSLGIYGVMGHAVARRTPEFGVRLAVGASPADLAALVIREVAIIALAGMAAGIPLALWSSRLVGGFIVGGFIFGTPTRDPVNLLFAAAVLAAAASFAAWRPARLAATMNPLDAIRAE
jgi:ABC-type antimicrobial peptide transport system permease subunit